MKFPRLKSIFIDFEDIIMINFSGSEKTFKYTCYPVIGEKKMVSAAFCNQAFFTY